MLGLYWDIFYIGIYCGYIGITDKNMETTIGFRIGHEVLVCRNPLGLD